MAIHNLINTSARLLLFRLSRAEFEDLDNRHLMFGLFCTWIVGIGRWWDDPGASLLQHLGVGSVVYVIFLALLLWAVVLPLNAANWSYKHVLTFVSLTSPPALLYAIPVERITDMSTARGINVWFLAIVAAWRVALLFFYLRRHARLSAFAIIVTALLPITAVIFALTVLNLERAVFDVMGGLREPGTSGDGAYAVLFVLTMLSIILLPVLLICYILAIVFSKSDGTPDSHKPPSIL